MGKKRKLPTAMEIMDRPFCYYCERDFDDMKILISHQKAKHFKCTHCNRRLNTAGGLQVHLQQVHKENLQSVENALPNRSDLSVEIFGMEGIPEDVKEAHNQRVLHEHYEKQHAHKLRTGNPYPGSGDPIEHKHPKVTEDFDMKQRIQDKLAGQENMNGNINGSSTNTPAPVSDNAFAPPGAPLRQVSHNTQDPRVRNQTQTSAATAAESEASAGQAPAAAPAPTEEEEAKPKTKKGKATYLRYSDNEIMPEEKMARMGRYAFQRNDQDAVMVNA